MVVLLHQPEPAVERLVANKGRAASPVKAVSRRRRGPKDSLYRACWSATLVPPSLTVGCHRPLSGFHAALRVFRDRRDDPGGAPN